MVQAERDTSKFVCLRDASDGSIYYGEIAFFDLETKQVVLEKDPTKKGPNNAEGVEQPAYKKVRSGYGLQIYNGQRNTDGIMTKYEGSWQNDERHGQGYSLFADGSSHKGSYQFGKIEGIGSYKWPNGHFFKGMFRDGMMSGRGEFKSNSGDSFKGQFKRNYALKGDCILNPLDEEAAQARTMKRLNDEVYLSIDALESKSQMHVYRVQQDADLQQALAETAEQGRIPIFVRTSRCPLEKHEVLDRVCNVLTLADVDETKDPENNNEEAPERVQEFDLRATYYLAKDRESHFKEGQKAEISEKVKNAVLKEQLLVLNLDDPDMQKLAEQDLALKEKEGSSPKMTEEERMRETVASHTSGTGAVVTGQPNTTNVVSSNKSQEQIQGIQSQEMLRSCQSVPGVSGPQNFDPNLSEYMGTSCGLPFPLWTPLNYKGKEQFFKAIGISQDDYLSVKPELINFCVWSQYVMRPFKQLSADKLGQKKAYGLGIENIESSPELVQASMQQVDDELSKIDTPQQLKGEDNITDRRDENSMTEEEMLARIKQRFEKSLPLEYCNVVLLMDLTNKHASIEQFEPLTNQIM